MKATQLIIFPQKEGRPAVSLPVVERKTVLRQSEARPNFDVAWLRFDGNLPEGYAPLEILPFAMAKDWKVGTEVVFVGHEKDIENESRLSALNSKVSKFLDSAHAFGLIFTTAGKEGGICTENTSGPLYLKHEESGKVRWYLAGVLSGFDGEGRFLSQDRERVCKGNTALHSSLGHFKKWIEETSGLELLGARHPQTFDFSKERPLQTEFAKLCASTFLPERLWMSIEMLLKKTSPESYDCHFAERALKTVDTLDLSGGLPSLDALRGFPQLKNLNLKNARVSDLSALSELGSLEKLTLDGVPVTDITPLGKLSNLKELSLSDCHIKNLSALGNLISLKSLRISRCDLGSLHGLLPLARRNLQNFIYSENSSVNVAALGQFVRLKQLKIDGPCPFPDPNSRVCNSGDNGPFSPNESISNCPFLKTKIQGAEEKVAGYANENLQMSTAMLPGNIAVLAGRKIGQAILVNVRQGSFLNRSFWISEKDLEERQTACGFDGID